jgi:hypothetical protein
MLKNKTTENYSFSTNKANFLLMFVLIIYLIYGSFLRIESLDIVRVNEWVTRDLDRAFNLVDGNYFPFAGPESSSGGRLPGPFLYLLLAIPLLAKYSYESIFTFNCILNISSLLLFFYISKKYFGFRMAAVSSILFSINLLHIDAVTFPINPAFIFPFIIILFGLLFDLAEKKNIQVFPIIFLIITLTIQIHYSAATFYIVPLWITLFLKIRIPLKIILKTVVVVLICLSPFLFYKTKTIEPNIKGVKLISEISAPGFLEIFKKITIQNTMNRITFRIGATPVFSPTNSFKLIHYVLSYLSFLYIVSFLLYQFIKRPAQKNSALYALFILFYLPALLYEVTNTHATHTWYSYIFLPSINLIIGFFLTNLIENLKRNKAKNVLTFMMFFLLFYLTYSTQQQFSRVKQNFSNRMEHGNPGLFFKNFALLKKHYGELIGDLGLSPEQFYDRVYYEGLTPHSKKFFELLGRNENRKLRTDTKTNSITCYYIIQKVQVISQNRNAYPLENARLDLFLNDPTIDIINLRPRELVLNDKRFLRSLLIYEYKPKVTQPCYQNSQNIFNVSTQLRNIHLYGKEIFEMEGSIPIKRILNREEFNMEGEFVAFSKSYIAFNKQWETPMQFDIQYSKTQSIDSLRFQIGYYSFVKRAFLFKIKQINLHLQTFTDHSSPKKKWLNFNLISPKSWRQNRSALENEFTNHFQWFREFKLDKDIKFLKDRFMIELSWEIEPKYVNSDLHEQVANQKIRFSLGNLGNSKN